MKKLIVVIVVFVLSITIALSQNTSSGARHSWVIVITPKTTIHQLDSLMAELEKANFILEISKLEYAKGKLVKIKGSVTYNSKSGLPNATFGSDNLDSWEIKVDDKPSVSVKGK
jgi:hypothetical protein